MSSMEEQFAQFQAFMAMQEAASTPDEVTSKVLENAPKAATQAKRSRAASSKAAASAEPVKRDTTSIAIVGGKVKEHAHGAPMPDGVVFVVTPTYGQGGLRTNGAALQPYLDGRAVKAWPHAVVSAFTDEVRETIAGLIETVNERALIGPHKPVKEAVAS